MDFSDCNIKKKARYELIADKLEEMILGEAGQTERKLPSEQYLADSFGVSRPVIREALGILKERGLIASKQGAASVITEPDGLNLMNSVNRIVQLKNVTVEQIYQIRIVLETLSVKLAAEKCAREDADALRAINRRIELCGKDYEARAKTDLSFHKELARISGNPLLGIMIEALSSLLLPIVVGLFASPLNRDDGILFHERIIFAVQSGDSDRAVDLMRAHMVAFAKNCEVCGTKTNE